MHRAWLPPVDWEMHGDLGGGGWSKVRIVFGKGKDLSGV